MEYKEILKLKAKLEKAKIPFEFTDDMFNTKSIPIQTREKIKDLIKDQYPAYSIVIIKNGIILCDAVEHTASYGNKSDKIEIAGALTAEEKENDEVLGYLTANEVFKRFKYCYKHNTSIYVEKEAQNETNNKSI